MQENPSHVRIISEEGKNRSLCGASPKRERYRMKKFASLLLAVIMVLTMVPLSFAEKAPGDLNTYATGTFNQGYDVYSGPGEWYYRVNDTRYGSAKCRIYGTVGDWLLVGFGHSGLYHIGYIPKDALNHCDDLQGTVEELNFLNIQDHVFQRGCGLTDDPVLDNPKFVSLSGGTPVTILGYMGSWAYVETQMITGTPVRGWVMDYYLNSGRDDLHSVPQTARPAPTQAPVTQAPVTQVPTLQPVVTAIPLPTQAPVTQAPQPSGRESLLSSLVHNCPNTGIMLPESFSPYQQSYVLTVASWVSRVTFTPTAYDSNAFITVNGQIVKNGQKSQVIQMTDDPQQVDIRVQGVNGSVTTYTVFLQRRPSEARTRVSVGYVKEIYQKNSEFYISADLVTVNYFSDQYYDGNRANVENDSTYLYKYVVDEHCDLYYGTTYQAYRARDIYEFWNNYQPYQLYTIVYIEDEIVAVMPFSAEDNG